MFHLDPQSMRSLSSIFLQGVSTLRERASRVKGEAEQLSSGPTGWKGKAVEAFSTSCILWFQDVSQICETIEHASTVFLNLASRMEHILQLKYEARQYEVACEGLNPENPQDQANLNYNRSRARELYAAAEMEGLAADQMAASSFREMESFERGLSLLHSSTWQHYDHQLLLAKLRGLSKAERMGYYDEATSEAVFLQDFDPMSNEELRAEIAARIDKVQEGKDETDLVNQGTSMILDATPIVGNLKSAVEAATGRDYITGEELSGSMRALAVAGIIFGGEVKFAGKAGKVAHDIETVEYGEHFTKIGNKKALKPNVKYVTEVGYEYTTDTQGRISKVEGKLDLGKAERNEYAQRSAGDADRESTDDGGHLIASIFKGSGEKDNLVPMDANLNRGAYKKLENVWKKALELQSEVVIHIEPLYPIGSRRPEKFKIIYWIDGFESKTVLENIAGG